MLQPTCWEPSAFQLTAEYLTHHLDRAFVDADGSLKDHLVPTGDDDERGAFYADLLSWTLGDLVGWFEGVRRETTERFQADLVTLYGDGPFATALGEAADRFGKDPLVVEVMVLLSTGVLSLKSRDDRWYVEPPPGAPRTGEEPFPAPIEPSWSAIDLTGFYQIVLPIPNVTLPEVPYEDPGDGSSGPAARASADLDALFDTVQAGVEMLQVNQAGEYLECQWQGRSPNLTTDWDSDGVTEVHRIGVVHGTISAKLDPTSDPAMPAYDGVRRMPAATTPGGTDVAHPVRLQFEPTSTGNMTVRLIAIAIDEDWVFTRQRHKLGDSLVDVTRPHMTDFELRKAPEELRSLVWGSDRAPLHSTEFALLALIADWIVERVDDATAVFGSGDAEEEIALGVPELMSYFGPEQLAHAQVQLRYLLEKWRYVGGPLGNWFGDDQNYWQALLVAIHETGQVLPDLLVALGVAQADIDAVLAEHHRYEFSNGTISTEWASKATMIAVDVLAEESAKAAWEVVKLGAKALFKAISVAKFSADGDIDFVTFTFNKLRLKDPSNVDSDFEVDDDAPGYPATLQGIQISCSGGLAWGLRAANFDTSTVVKTGREQWSPTDWAGPYVVLQVECGVGLLELEEWLPNPVRFVLNQLGLGHEEGAAIGLNFFYRWPEGATVPEMAWAFDPWSWIESTGVFLNVGSVGVSFGWLCEHLSTDTPGDFFGGLVECVFGAQGEMPDLVEAEMESGAVLTATASAFLANASRVDDAGLDGLDDLGSFVAKNLHAFRHNASSMLVHGHASPDGSELHNRCLSERRVEYVQRMVAAMLGRDFVIHPSRIEGLGLGESVSQDVSEPNDPTWRVVELGVNRAGMRLLVEAMP